MEGRDIHSIAEIYMNEVVASPTAPTTQQQKPPTAASPAPSAPNLNDLRAASARATMAGPSREAQALMSDRTKNILGAQRLQAGAQAQDAVAQMRAAMPSPTSTPRAAINPEWAKANPKLAAAETERQRTRGTAQTTNPMMGGMTSRMPQATPTSKTPTAPSAPTKSTTPTLTPQQQSLYKQAYSNRNNPLAKGRIQSELNKMTPEQRKLFQQYAQSQGQEGDWSGYKFESYILKHLIDEGYATSEKAAIKIMENMSETWMESILNESPLEGLLRIFNPKALEGRNKKPSQTSKPIQTLRNKNQETQAAIDYLK